MSRLDHLPDAEREALIALPHHIFRLVAAADGRVETAEVEAHLERLVASGASPLVAELHAAARLRYGLDAAEPPDPTQRAGHFDGIKRGLIALERFDDAATARAELLAHGRAVAEAGLGGAIDERRLLRTLDQFCRVRWAPPGADPVPLDDARLAALRGVTDPVADTVVGPYMRGEVDRAALDRVLAELGHSDDPADCPPGLAAYLDASARMPFWADPALIVAGQALFVRHAPVVILALFTAALPRMYSLRDGVQVLALSARLSSHTGRRVVETAQFLIDVLTPGELLDGGRGLHTLQKVRLVHGAVRHHARASSKWDPAWGEPINQQDQLSVALQLSVGLLDGMRRLDVDFTADEVHAFVHTWCVVAAMLGVDDRWLPRTGPEAEALWRRITALQQGATPEGRLLTGHLLDYMQEILGGLKLGRGAAEALMVESLGPETAALLGVEASTLQRAALAPLKVLSLVRDRLGDHSGLIGRLQGKAGTALLQRLVQVFSAGQAVDFVVPDTLMTGR